MREEKAEKGKKMKGKNLDMFKIEEISGNTGNDEISVLNPHTYNGYTVYDVRGLDP